jgi:hypothetical protein
MLFLSCFFSAPRSKIPPNMHVTDVEIRCFDSGEKILRTHVSTVNQKFGAPNYTGTHQIAPIPPVHAVSAFQH